MATIHQVDVGRIGLESSEPTSEDLLSVGREIAESFRSAGFAYLRNHGISQQLQDNTFTVANGFFELEDSKKLAFERFVKTGYNGYTAIAGENSYHESDKAVNLINYRECYDLLNLGKDYPDSVAPELGPQLELLGSACCRLSLRLLAALDAALGGSQLLVSCHQRQLQEGGNSVLRVIHYPPVPAHLDVNATRCAAHTDYGTMTLLFQHGVGGLEVETKPDVWEAAEPLPGTILVNIGDMIELWTSGQLRATNHRVLLPESAPRNTLRQSITFFVTPDDGTTVAPLDGDPQYQPVDAGAFLRKQYAATYPAFASSPFK